MRILLKSYLFVAFIFLLNQFIIAQDTTYKYLLPVEGLKYKKLIFSVATTSDIEMQKPVSINLGGEIGIHIKLFSKSKQIKRHSEYDIITADRDLFIKPTFGFIFRERYHTGLYLIPSLVYRHTTPKSIFIELNADVGYYHAKLNTPTYQQTDDGSFEEIRGYYPQLLCGGKLITGVDFSKNKNTPLCLFAGLGVMYTYPNNQSWTRHINIQAGLSYILRRNLD